MEAEKNNSENVLTMASMLEAFSVADKRSPSYVIEELLKPTFLVCDEETAEFMKCECEELGITANFIAPELNR